MKEKNFNLNTVLLGVLLGLLAWNGNKIVAQLENQSRDIRQMEQRLTKLESRVL